MRPVNDGCDPGTPGPAPTESYWQCPPHALAFHQSAKLPAKTSIVIIGSGITGTSVAHHLLKASPGLSIVMLEARTITSGATGRNGGHCKDVPFKTYRQSKDKFGKTAAQRLAKFRSSHVDSTRQLAHELREAGYMDSQFRNVESVTAVFDPQIFQGLVENLEEWLKDFPDQRKLCSVLDGKEAQKKYGLLGAAGVLTLQASALWPYRLVTGALERLLQKHANFSLEAFTPVSSIVGSDDPLRPYLVHTARGTIQTQHVIHCTNGHAAHLLPSLRGKIIPRRGQMTVLTPPASFPRLGHTRSWSFYWPNGGFDYMTQAAGEEGDVFLGGGGEHGAAQGVVDLGSTKDSELNRPALEHLCAVLPEHFEQGKGTLLKQAWTGVMGFTPDDLPIVGRVPRELGQRNVPEHSQGSEWIAAGFNGYGMVHCWHSGRAVAEMILERPQETIDDYFPREQFECSRERLEAMDLKGMEASYHKNVPANIRSRL